MGRFRAKYRYAVLDDISDTNRGDEASRAYRLGRLALLEKPRKGLYVSAFAPIMIIVVFDRRAGGWQTFVPALRIFSPNKLLLIKSGEIPYLREKSARLDRSYCVGYGTIHTKNQLEPFLISGIFQQHTRG